MKTKTINGILCGYLKLIYVENGIVAVNEEAEIKEGDFLFSKPIPDGIGWNFPVEYVRDSENNILVGKINQPKGTPCSRLAKNLWWKIIAASSSLNLPVLILPEREDEKNMAKEKYPNSLLSNGNEDLITSVNRDAFIAGFRAHAASHPFSESDMRKCALWFYGIAITKDFDGSLKEFLSSIRPQGVWCEVEEIFVPFNEQRYGTPKGEEEGMFKKKFKTNGQELIVIEWE